MYISSGNRNVVASVNNDPETVAMFQLFAAAPDMLEVLQELNECASYWSQYDVPVGIHDRIKLAIAKAKGEQE
jgi:thiamine monophosphate synthase